MSRRRISTLRLILVLGGIGVLEALCRMGTIDPLVFLPPSEIVAALAEIISSGKATRDILATAKVVSLAIAVSLVLGVLGGLALHALPRLKRAVAPSLTSYYAIPVFVLYPTFILLFGMNEIPLVIVGALFAVIVMAINTMNGLDRVPAVFEKTARTMNLSAVERVWFVLLPSALPFLLTGLKLVVAYCFIGVIAAEFILSTVGLGHAIAFAYNDFDNRTMYGLMLLVLGSVTIINLGLHSWEQRIRRLRGEA